MKSNHFREPPAGAHLRLRCKVRVFALTTAFTGIAAAQECPDLPNPIYGAGGSAVTPTLGAVASALAGLPAEERVSIFYWDPGACTGYHSVVDVGTDLATPPAYFKYWDADGTLHQCEAAGDEVLSFAHMGNTPTLCPANQPLPNGWGRFVAPVQTINFITHIDSEYDAISVEALYHVYGFGPGAPGRSVAPWTVPEAVFSRPTNSFVHQIAARIVGVPPTGFQIPEENFLSTNGDSVQAVYTWGQESDPSQPLAYVSGSNADQGFDDGQIKTLALQDIDQTCAYLPDSSRQAKDKLNVRNGQYALWTPAWFYAPVDGTSSDITHPDVAKLVRWFDGSLPAPEGVDIVSIIIQSGDIPLCAMRATRPDGDLSAIASYAPDDPCNGYFEFTAEGRTDYQSCSDTSECDEAAGEQCRYGFCELY